MSELKTHVTDAFKRYGTAAACAGKIAEAIKNENWYCTDGVYAPVIDLTELVDPDDDDMDEEENQEDSSDDELAYVLPQ